MWLHMWKWISEPNLWCGGYFHNFIAYVSMWFPNSWSMCVCTVAIMFRRLTRHFQAYSNKWSKSIWQFDLSKIGFGREGVFEITHFSSLPACTYFGSRLKAEPHDCIRQRKTICRPTVLNGTLIAEPNQRIRSRALISAYGGSWARLGVGRPPSRIWGAL